MAFAIALPKLWSGRCMGNAVTTITNMAARSFFLVIWIAMVGWAASPVSAMSQEVLTLSDDDEFHLRLTPYLAHFADMTRRLSVDDIVAGAGAFTPVTTPYPDFGLGPQRHWLKAAVENPLDTDGVWRLDFDRQYMQELRAWIVRNDGTVTQIFASNDEQPFTARKINDRLLAIDFAMDAGERAQIIIGYTTTIVSFLPVAIGTIDGVRASHQAEYMIDMLFHGGLLAVLAIGLLMIPITGWPLSVSFGLYVVAGMAYVFHADGYTFQYIWPKNPQFNDPANLSFMLLMGVFGLLFARALFPVRRDIGWLNALQLAYIIIAGTLALTSPLYIQVPTMQTMAYSLVPLGALTQVVTGIAASQKRYVGATPYALGAFIVLTSFAYAVIAHLRPGYFNLDTTLDYGHATILFDSLCFIAAMVLRMIGVRNERDRALREQLVSTQNALKSEATLRQSQAAYEKARRLAETNRTRLQDMSHDLHVPLAQMRRHADQIKERTDIDSEKMLAAVEYLEGLVGVATRGSHEVDRGVSSTPQIEDFDLQIIMDSVYELHADAAAEAGMVLRNRRRSHDVLANPVMIMRLVSNLVANAVAHSSGTAILMSARCRSDGVVLEVWDNGKGMTDAQRQTFLTRGQKSAASEGSGYGLAIAAEAAKATGSQLEICSKPGTGTRMRVVLLRGQGPK
ncbi:MAG: sensor histidine kinase [Pseudomonadota bacterium]